MNQPTLFSIAPNGKRIPVDICSNRHKGNDESRAANPSQEAKRASHERILELLGWGHKTSKELAEAMHTPLHAISGRCSELKALGKIEPTGTRREGAMELRRV